VPAFDDQSTHDTIIPTGSHKVWILSHFLQKGEEWKQRFCFRKSCIARQIEFHDGPIKMNGDLVAPDYVEKKGVQILE
jgi:hypothetical protein